MRMIMAVACAWMLILSVFSYPTLAAGPLLLEGDFIQGGLVTGRAPGARKVLVDGRSIRIGPGGVFVFGFGRDFGPRSEMVVEYGDGSRKRRVINVQKRRYKTQRIDGLEPAKVTPPKKVYERIKAENARIAAVRALDTPEALFLSGWQWPVKGPISGVFGSQRILNGKPKRPHYGLDIAAPAGSPVVAPADGIVRLAEKDLYYTGGTVMLDHGFGITSVYSHMQTVTVQVGQRLRRGEQLGTVGATGRVTGPHLDWRVNWFGERLDPAFLIGLKTQ